MNYVNETKMHISGYLITDFRIPKHLKRQENLRFKIRNLQRDALNLC